MIISLLLTAGFTILAIFCAVQAVRAARRRRRRKHDGIGFLSMSEQKAVLSSKHILRVFPGSRACTVAVETRFKYPTGSSIIIEADVRNGKLYLVEPETQRAIDLRLLRYVPRKRETSGVYPLGSQLIFEQSGCFVGPTGLIQYGPVPFSPEALIEGVCYMAQACSDIYALPA